MKYPLPLLLSFLLLGGCASVNSHSSAASPSGAQSVPGQILYGADTVVECTYNQGCRTVRP